MVASAFIVLALIALLGSLLRYLLPDLDVDRARQMIGVLVLHIFLPALNFRVIVQSELGEQFWQVPLCAAGALAVCLLAGFVAYRLWGVPRTAQGSLILAGGIGNVTYFGLPLLQGLYPKSLQQVTEVVILYEMTITPLNLLAGSALASAYGHGQRLPLRQALGRLARMPLLWAVAVALSWKMTPLAVPEFLLQIATLLGQVVPGLMILSLGMALKAETLRGLRHGWSAILPATTIKLVLSRSSYSGPPGRPDLSSRTSQQSSCSAACPHSWRPSSRRSTTSSRCRHWQ